MSPTDEERWVGPRPAADGLVFAMSSSLIISIINVYVLFLIAGLPVAVAGAFIGFIATFMVMPHIVAVYFRIPVETLLKLQ